MDKETKKEFQSLAQIVKKGFDHVDEKFTEVGKELQGLKQGQEDIKLRLDQVAYRFELQALEKRVKKLELKAGMAKN